MFKMSYLTRITVLFLCLPLIGCALASSKDLKYDGSNIWAVPETNLHFAVRPFADRSGNTSKFRSDIVSYGLVLDLRESDAGPAVHFNPPVLEDYDLVIDGVIEPGGKLLYRAISPYWRGPLVEQVSLDTDGDGSRLDRLEDFYDAVEDANRKFLRSIGARLEIMELPNAERTRALRFYHALDPEISKLQQLAGSAANDPEGPHRFKRELRRRTKMLEKYRKAERKIIKKRQDVIAKAHGKREKWFEEVEDRYYDVSSKEAAAVNQASAHAFSKFTSALVAGLTPAMKQANFRNSWSSAETRMAVQDTSNAMGAIKPNPEGTNIPDYKPFYEMLGQRADQLTRVDVMPDMERGRGSIANIRKKFLRKYRRKITPLSRLR